MEKVSKLVAIKRFIEKDSRPCNIIEMKQFREGCTDEQLNGYAMGAAQELGVELI